MNSIRKVCRRRLVPRLLFLLLALLFGWACIGWGCGEAPPESTGAEDPPPGDRAATEAEPPANPAPNDGPDETRLVFLGDSLTAGYGLAEEQAFPHLVEERLEAEGYALEVVNAGVSGDTTAGGLSRLNWLLRQEPDVLVVGLGGNDGLRGIELESTEANLRRIVETAREAGAEVLLLGMLIPPNYGEEYTEAFAAMYPRLEEELDVARVPFVLEGVAGDPGLNLPDGIHPNARGQEILARTVAEHLRPLLDDA